MAKTLITIESLKSGIGTVEAANVTITKEAVTYSYTEAVCGGYNMKSCKYCTYLVAFFILNQTTLSVVNCYLHFLAHV